jgi:hypothetical protein
MIKKVLMTVFVCSAFAVAIRADEEKPAPPSAPSEKPVPPSGKPDKRQLTDEQRTVMKEMRAKYDTNKDGKIDAAERKAMSAEDKEKLTKLLGTQQQRRNRGKEAK